jgi:hypothetical protein
LGRASSFLGRGTTNHSNSGVVALAKSASMAGRSYVFGQDNSNSGWGGNGNDSQVSGLMRLPPVLVETSSP